MWMMKRAQSDTARVWTATARFGRNPELPTGSPEEGSGSRETARQARSWWTRTLLFWLWWWCPALASRTVAAAGLPGRQSRTRKPNAMATIFHRRLVQSPRALTRESVTAG